MPGNCSFNMSWLRNDSYKEWLIRDNVRLYSRARCKICVKSFDIRAMGESALKIHMNGKKHLEFVSQLKASESLKDESKNLSRVVTTHQDAEVETRSSGESTRPTHSMLSIVRSGGGQIATKNDVLSAELLWALKMSTAHYSHKSSESSDLLFQKMFPDSAIAKSFKCGETKSSYLINHGAAPYFKSLLSQKIKSEPCEFVLLFDESMNSKTQNKQMDFHVRIWEGQEVRTRYYHSEFMGHATAEDMVSVKVLMLTKQFL
jgi:hypothetical protein